QSRFDPALQLRGSVLVGAQRDSVLLLLSPWITRLQDIERIGLTLADFAPHDPVADLLFVQQANVAALEDTKHLATKLKERTERLDAISGLSPDGILAFGPDGDLAYANPAFQTLFGIDTADLLEVDAAAFGQLLRSRADPGRPLPDLLTPVDEAPEENDVPAGGRRLLHLSRPDSRVLACSVRRGEGGSKVLYFRDVTRETEVDRMKSEFLSTAAHELRTPMASVFGFSELLLKRNFDEKTRTDLLNTIHRQAGALIHLLNELLDLARIEARAGKDFKIHVQPLRPIIEQTVSALLVPNDPRKVTVELPDSLPHCAVDAEKLQQALTNLLSNAYKYSPDGGEIRLDIVHGEHAGEIGVRVRDHGIGMTPEQLSRCFERFYRADASGNIPGTGLGLSLVKEIIEILGGRIDLQSSHGNGTTVTVWLKVAETHARAA
ncbi:MAG: PAS domain-containing protein, partial [Planctomycetes bacterium]|nr:PAS domain-containing protein [Planctomycetota bacterium]